MSQSAAPNAQQITTWNEQSGPTWAELHDLLDLQIEPLGAVAMDALDPQPGERVFDVGCGAAQTTIALAERVGPTGSVLGLDISRPLLEVARRRTAGLPQVALVEADAQTHAFEPASFDALYSRFGVMFFDDPEGAFANMRRGLKPAGRVGFVCWRRLEENPAFNLGLSVGLRHLPAPPAPPPGAPGPFAFADPERVRSILQAAGFGEIEIRSHDQKIGGYSLEDAVQLFLRVGPLGAMLRERPEARPALVGDLREAFAALVEDGRVWLDSATWIVTARNR